MNEIVGIVEPVTVVGVIDVFTAADTNGVATIDEIMALLRAAERDW